MTTITIGNPEYLHEIISCLMDLQDQIKFRRPGQKIDSPPGYVELGGLPSARRRKKYNQS